MAGGEYYDSSNNHRAMVVTESGGHWARACELKLPSNAEPNPYAEVNSVACTGVGSCVAVGNYQDGSGRYCVTVGSYHTAVTYKPMAASTPPR